MKRGICVSAAAQVTWKKTIYFLTLKNLIVGFSGIHFVLIAKLFFVDINIYSERELPLTIKLPEQTVDSNPVLIKKKGKVKTLSIKVFLILRHHKKQLLLNSCNTKSASVSLHS